MMKICLKIFYLLNKKNNFFFIISLSFLLGFIDLSAISTIGILVTNLFDAEIKNNFVNNFFLKIFHITDSENLVIILSIILLIILFLRSLMFFLVTYLINRYTLNEEYLLKNKIFKYIGSTDYHKIIELGKNEFIATILSYSRQYRSNVLINIIKMATDISLIIVIVAYLFINYPQNTLFLIVISILIVLIFTNFIKKKMISYGHEINNIYKKELGIANDYYTSFKLYKILKKDSFLLQKFFSLFKRYKINITYNEIVNLLPRFLFEYSFYAILFSIIFLSKNNQAYILQSMSAFFYAAMRIIPSFTIITNAIFKIIRNKDTIERLFKLIKNYEIISNDKQDTIHISKFNKIKFTNISFGYKSKDLLLSNINFEIDINDKIGIIGESGIGKSTFFNILVGLLKNSNLKVFIDSKRIDNDKLISLDLFYYLNQSHILFDESLETNITLEINKKNIDYKKFEKCLDDCYLSDFILSKKNKKYSELEKDNINLSGGQIQRLLIARALYNNKKILILDESTNAMDDDLQQKIIENIFKYYKTVIISSHNKDFINKNCNKIYTIKKGSLFAI